MASKTEKERQSLKREIHRTSLLAVKAMKKAVVEVIKNHARTGDPLAIWRDGKVVWVPAAQLLRQNLRKERRSKK